VAAGSLPVVYDFIPISVDAYVLPRAGLALVAGGVVFAAGLMWGRQRLEGLRLPIVAVALAAVAAAAVSVSPAVSLVGTYSRYESLPMRLAYIGLLVGAARLGERQRVVVAYLVGCGVVSVEALWQVASHQPFRPDGNLGQPNLLGALLAMAMPLALEKAWAARRARQVAWRGWLAMAGLYALALAVSTSRSGWLGALVGLAAAAVFVTPRRLLPAAGVAGGLAVAAAAAVLLLSPLRGLNQDTGTARIGVWRDSLAVIAERPLTGWGEDTMGLVFGLHQSGDWEPGHNFDRAHSMPLDLAATQGLLGLAACAWLFGAWWLSVWRRRGVPGSAGFAGAAAAYLVWSLLNFDWAPATAAFWLLVGAGWLPALIHGNERPARRKTRSYTYMSGIAALVGVVTGLVAAMPPMAADIAFHAGRADVASRLDPLQAHYHAVQGTLPELRLAAQLGDTDPATYIALGDAERRAGNPGAADAAYRQALARYPYAPVPAGFATGRLRVASG
jgi:O-antigen ligase